MARKGLEERIVSGSSDSLCTEPDESNERDYTRHEPADCRFRPLCNNAQRRKSSTEPEKEFAKEQRDQGGGDTQNAVECERGGVVESIPARHGEHWMLAEHAPLDDRGERRCDDDPRKHRLVEVADDLLEREGHGSDRRVERGRHAGGRTDREESRRVLARERRGSAELTDHAGANVDGRALSAERRAGADLKRGEEELTDRIPKRHSASLHGIGDLDLRNATSARVRDDLLEKSSTHEAARTR